MTVTHSLPARQPQPPREASIAAKTKLISRSDCTIAVPSAYYISLMKYIQTLQETNQDLETHNALLVEENEGLQGLMIDDSGIYAEDGIYSVDGTEDSMDEDGNEDSMDESD